MPETVTTAHNGNGHGTGSVDLRVHDWQVQDVLNWALNTERCTKNVAICLEDEQIDGEVLLTLTEADIRDFRYRFNHMLTFSELKKFWLSVQALQQSYFGASPQEFQPSLPLRNILPPLQNLNVLNDVPMETRELRQSSDSGNRANSTTSDLPTEPLMVCNMPALNMHECPLTCSPTCSIETKCIPPEFFKTAISLGYSFLVTWITSFVMVIVHERVPDMKRYPPLPDIFLDNVPHIPWAFHMCEITGTLLFAIWICVIILHKHRTVLLRRFFAMAGTVFLLRCVTMLITSLSVPGTHLQCDQNDYAIDDAQ